jgi:hypothetical protein
MLCACAALAQAKLVDVIEFYNAGLDHYFISSLAADIQALDSGRFAGWTRTGLSFKAYDGPAPGTNPVCRFYIPPAQGDSHFYSASPAECADVRTKFPTFDYESAAVMYVGLPDTATGACGPGLVPVFRLWNQRADSNHRYTTDPGVRASMIAKGYLPEGYGPDGVAMCAIAASAKFDVKLSAASVVLLPGGARDTYVTITPNAGAIGLVNISVSAAPAGVTQQLSDVALDVASVPVGTLLHFAAAASATPTAQATSVTVTVTDASGTSVAAVLSVGIAAAGDAVATKLAAIAAVESRGIDFLKTSTSAPAFAQSIAAFMATRPEYVASGIDNATLSAWGRFADGTAHVATINRLPAASAAVAENKYLRLKDGGEVPQTARARLLQSFAAFESAEPIDRMSGYLNAMNWRVTTGSTASVAALMTVNGDGFFYLNTHGGAVVDQTNPNRTVYSVQTSTLVEGAIETVYLPMVLNGELVYFTAPQDTVTIKQPGLPNVDIPLLDTRYAITYKFVNHYMSFAGSSVVLMNACFSSTDATFIDAFTSKGAGAYLGWSRLLSPAAAFEAAPYFVDRMLGSNKQAPVESPPQRPFPYDQVLQDMATKGLNTDKQTGATLTGFSGQSAQPPIFAPSIRRVWVLEPDQSLHIEGAFSSDQSDPPKVTVGGASVNVRSSAADEIVAQLPGPTASGDVIVEIRGVKSNARQLTLWSMPITYAWNPALFQGWKMQGSGTVRLRADIAGYRTSPAGPLIFITPGGPATTDSSIQITGSGSYTTGGCTATLSGNYTFGSPFASTGGIPKVFLNAQFAIDGNLKQGVLSLLLGATDVNSTFLETYSGDCGGAAPDHIPAASGAQDGGASVPVGQDDHSPQLSLPLALKLQLDSNYAIKADSRPSLPSPGVQGAGTVTYSWPSVPASGPPRDTADSGK